MDLETGWIASGIAAAVFLLAVATAVHALLQRRETGAVIAWVGLIFLLPLAGSILYWLFGINRIRRRARALREGHSPAPAAHRSLDVDPDLSARWRGLLGSGDALSPFTVAPGNRVTPLFDGDRAYQAMLYAIDGAQRRVTLATYIFDADPIGLHFAERLKAARDRGVDVRVLIDGIGARYSRRSMLRHLRRLGVRTAAFLPVQLPRTVAVFNLRNHRKLLVVDGTIGFTGGMNIRRGHCRTAPGKHPIHDLHFEIEGPVVEQLEAIFCEDWHFSTRERVTTAPGSDRPAGPPPGHTPCRGLPDGPDEDFEVLQFTLLAALAEARERVTIVTPYFLPDVGLLGALKTAALRGVQVDILLPERSNLRLVQWAGNPLHTELVERGCRLWLTPPPFNHSKLMLVDECWVLFGSGNWDPRSLRLNFEFNVECYDAELGRRLGRWASELRARSRRLDLAEIQKRPIPMRLRDGAARLLTPYL
ncbi:Cardiolipin synthetase [Thioalkalivibrio nitratireducens DSM 14787]|uniref:Cardiolipin synthetase n=1 Tax=Thioalkalivibrio nitratireducens (strain DSM 14787 / UNIQEM 213 / ALEN2) TaxID=1255043 RepID=L0E0Q3_THIND|nr:phospholipase D-like domain-containing protein [Thioalkalivibrio nitratireducens]AGA34832.1 Cardiolipin synthetase [Thioalkalivibrio nitratireducens DSM 14787]